MLPEKKSFRTLSVLSGSLLLRWDGGEHQFGKGDSVLLPSALSSVEIEAASDTCCVLTSVPDILEEIVRPLRRAGIPDARINLLGGNPQRNDVTSVLRS